LQYEKCGENINRKQEERRKKKTYLWLKTDLGLKPPIVFQGSSPQSMAFRFKSTLFFGENIIRVTENSKTSEAPSDLATMVWQNRQKWPNELEEPNCFGVICLNRQFHSKRTTHSRLSGQEGWGLLEWEARLCVTMSQS